MNLLDPNFPKDELLDRLGDLLDQAEAEFGTKDMEISRQKSTRKRRIQIIGALLLAHYEDGPNTFFKKSQITEKFGEFCEDGLNNSQYQNDKKHLEKIKMIEFHPNHNGLVKLNLTYIREIFETAKSTLVNKKHADDTILIPIFEHIGDVVTRTNVVNLSVESDRDSF
ncbi:MAG: hypothetical protein GPJ54_01840 [Candidatus Heimdallarchaeota archaeon]|nr:hypothetical protein [Candidatus Heimdallarchaeota archaeon]